jgi:hypothetical protein
MIAIFLYHFYLSEGKYTSRLLNNVSSLINTFLNERSAWREQLMPRDSKVEEHEVKATHTRCRKIGIQFHSSRVKVQ